MTRTEFDQQIRELKNKRNAAIREVAALQSEIKEEIASKQRMIQEIGKEVQKLKQSLQGYYQRRIALDAEWNSKINAFIKENEPLIRQRGPEMIRLIEAILACPEEFVDFLANNPSLVRRDGYLMIARIKEIRKQPDNTSRSYRTEYGYGVQPDPIGDGINYFLNWGNCLMKNNRKTYLSYL
jgi:uncharacterized coiled-coil DUF342 family protein